MTIEGSTVTLECAANGYPKPSILWLKDGVAIDLASYQSRYVVKIRVKKLDVQFFFLII